MGNLIGIALNLQIALGSMTILTILILPIQKHGISLNYLQFPLSMFHSSQRISLLPPWSGLLLGIFFKKGILLSLSDISLLV